MDGLDWTGVGREGTGSVRSRVDLFSLGGIVVARGWAFCAEGRN